MSFVPPDSDEEPDIFPPQAVIDEESQQTNTNGVTEPTSEPSDEEEAEFESDIASEGTFSGGISEHSPPTENGT